MKPPQVQLRPNGVSIRSLKGRVVSRVSNVQICCVCQSGELIFNEGFEPFVEVNFR